MTVDALDPYGNLATSFDGAVTIGLAIGSGGNLSGTVTETAGAGVATFGSLVSTRSGTVELTASSGTLTTGTTGGASVAVGPAPPSQLVIQSQPTATATAGQAIATAAQPIVVAEEDRYGNLESGDDTTVVTASAAANFGKLLGTTDVTLSGGLATFTDLSTDVAGAVTLLFGAGSLAPASSSPVAVVAAAPAQLVVQTQPSPTAIAGQPFAVQPVVVEEDAFGNIETGDNSTVVTVTPGNGAVAFPPHDAPSALAGTTSVTLSGGVATFSGLAEDVETSFPLTFFAGSLPMGVSNTVTVEAAAPAKLELTVGPPSSLVAGEPFGIIVTAVDAYGNVARNFDGPVTVSVAGEPGATATMQAQSGVAGFTGLTVDTAAQGVSVQISSEGLTTSSAPLQVSGNSGNSGGGGTPPVVPTIDGESVVMARKTNKKGKPVGKATLSGFTLQFSTAMNAATAGSSSNYTVESATIKLVKKKKETILKPVAFSASYNAATNMVTLTLVGKQTFAQGGEITVVYAPGGVDSEQGVALSPDDAEFTIQPKATGVSPD